MSINFTTNPPIVGFNSATEGAYLLGLDIGTGLAIAVHLLFYRLVFLFTPKEMFNYRLTVSNTSSWCLLSLTIFGLLLRPVPLFPIPAAKVTGPLHLLGELGGQIGWQLGVICMANFLTASMICFTVLAIFLLEPRGVISTISRKQGLLMGMGAHLVTTAGIGLLLNLVYKPTNGLKAKLLAQFPADIQPILALDNGTTAFSGYDPSSGPQFLALSILLLFLAQGGFCTFLYAILLRSIWGSINKGSREETAKSRRNVVLMLTARMTFPTIFGIFPIMAICAGITFGIGKAFGCYCALCAIAISHGFLNICATIGAYKPYRDGLLKGFQRAFGWTGLVPVQKGSQTGTLNGLARSNGQQTGNSRAANISGTQQGRVTGLKKISISSIEANSRVVAWQMNK